MNEGCRGGTARSPASGGQREHHDPGEADADDRHPALVRAEDLAAFGGTTDSDDEVVDDEYAGDGGDEAGELADDLTDDGGLVAGALARRVARDGKQ